jgi:tetratricopeptide (TPR) repeat protein
MPSGKLLSLKFVVVAGVLLSAIVVAVMAIPSTPSSITWERDYATAIERARSENKLIIADMFTDWCVLCKQMDATTVAEPQLIAEMADKYVWLKLNTETEEDGKRLQKEFAILDYPTILVLDADGAEVDRVAQFMPSPQFRKTVATLVDSPESLASLRRSVEAQPDSVAARYALAEKYLSRNDYAKAAPQFQKVIELDPDNREAKTDLSRYNLALCLASEQKFEEALVELDRLETRFPQSSTMADAAVLRGQVYHCCSRLDDAQAVLRAYLTKYPTHARIKQVEDLLAAIEITRSATTARASAAPEDYAVSP